MDGGRRAKAPKMSAAAASNSSPKACARLSACERAQRVLAESLHHAGGSLFEISIMCEFFGRGAAIADTLGEAAGGRGAPDGTAGRMHYAATFGRLGGAAKRQPAAGVAPRMVSGWAPEAQRIRPRR